MSEMGWLVLGALCSVIMLAAFFTICVVRLVSKFSSHAVELARLSKAGSLKEVIADEHSEDGPVFTQPPSDEYEAELEELMVRDRRVPPHEQNGPRLRGEE
jgi:hypothetical protein